MSGFGQAGPPPAAVIPGWTHLRTGKVRDLYSDASGRLLMVTSDRISAFDWVLPTPIPTKGAVLTQLSLFWFEQLKSIVPNHVISVDVPSEVKGRAVIVKPLTMFPIECVARGYLTGSGWSEYKKSQSVCGIPLPSGLLDGSQLPENIFTPATKAAVGDHDININLEQALEIVPKANELSDLTLQLYSAAADYAKGRGIILADTKFEFGVDENDEITLGDEALTPDSSRFWDAQTWSPGGAQPSFDKQFVRDYLVESGWDRESPPPQLPAEIVEKTAERYRDAYLRLTGTPFQD
ncbi:MAG TPA: phosphoribosylaminoimidazolesuccinocarboxamide synthase [Candidatus Paceibacterota bacterium]|nr:phosphoribosylaminoimidazolesuccinocarboxamide synthase [Candidatus Paceibacterota bacterium]